ncbi:MAG TPA: hypothetical protein VFY49_08220 [Myxococcota bacterium]|nr:hypothetical protein [Myxococcota bacterium]
MGKAFGILLIVVAIWLGLQYYAGETASPPPRDPEARAVSPAKRVGERVQDSLAQGEERQNALMPE